MYGINSKRCGSISEDIAIPKVLVIFPAKNEEETIEHVITTAKQSRYVPEIIVVDAFSSNRTAELAVRRVAQWFSRKLKCFLQKELQ